jgi:hypothetical protein
VFLVFCFDVLFGFETEEGKMLEATMIRYVFVGRLWDVCGTTFGVKKVAKAVNEDFKFLRLYYERNRK